MDLKRSVTQFKMIPPGDLIPYDKNARVHSAEQIAALRRSLREYGFIAPMVIDMDRRVIVGHGRLAAAVSEGWPEVPCVIVDHLSPTQLRAYILADNRLSDMASWDDALVSEELQALKDAGVDITLTGFSDEDILLAEPDDAFEDDFDPTPPAVPTAKRGDIWQLGRHRLMCGDATDCTDVAKLMAGAKLDLLLTDPPYNVDITGGTADHLQILNDDFKAGADFTDFLTRAFCAADAVMRPGAPYYIWHADGATGLNFREACAAAGWQVRQCLIWVKQSATLSRQDYHWQHEPCLHGEKDDEAADDGQRDLDHLSSLYGWTDGAGHRWYGDRKQTTVVEFDRPAKSADHPTMKPVRLFDWQLRNSSRPGALVGDFFAGSGTTLAACEQAGRVAYCMELDPRYVDVIIRRWKTLTGAKAVLL